MPFFLDSETKVMLILENNNKKIKGMFQPLNKSFF